jgi:16S rRNA C1402 N4-methylase RsmH
LGRIIWRYGEEKYYKKIAHSIVYFRNQFGEIKTTKQLVDIISAVIKEYKNNLL